MKDTYLYPAVFEYAADGISIEFPDLPGCLPCGMTTEEAVKNAKEALALHLYGMEQDGESIPEPSDPAMLAKDHAVVMLIEVFMPPIREKIANKTIKNAHDSILAECTSRTHGNQFLQNTARSTDQ